MNKNVSDLTAHNIRQKADLYWSLWDEFASCLQRVHELDAMALLELPRGCDYWNDDRMMSMVNGTQSNVHDFDPWVHVWVQDTIQECRYVHQETLENRFLGVSSNDLHSTCDGSHTHGPCAGRETRLTQLYTDKIVRCLLRNIKNQMIIRLGYAKSHNASKPVGIARTCVCVKTDDERKSTHDDQHLLFNYLVGRGVVKVKSLLNDYRVAAWTDPDPPQTSLIVAMAEKKQVFPSAVKVIRNAESTLQRALCN